MEGTVRASPTPHIIELNLRYSWSVKKKRSVLQDPPDYGELAEQPTGRNTGA